MIQLYPPGPTGWAGTAPVGEPAGDGALPAERIYDEMAFPDPPPGRPLVFINMVATVDGKVTLAGGTHPRPIGSRVDRTLMVRLRAHADAVLRGATTVRRNPYYPAVPEEVEARRQAAGRASQPLACTVSGSGALDPDLGFFRRAPRRPLVFVGPDAPSQALQALREVADVHRAPPGGRGTPGGAVPVTWMLGVLRQQYGVRHLLCEGGPGLNFALFEARCVDELFLTVAPFVAGSAQDRTAVHGPRLLEPFAGLELVSSFFHEGELFLRYRVRPGAETE